MVRRERTRTSYRSRVILGSALGISASLMIWLFVCYPVKTFIAAGIVIFLIVAMLCSSHPLMVDEASTPGGQQ
jgi:hypothetical protein